MKKKYLPLYIVLFIGLLLGFVTVFLHKEYQTVRLKGDITRFVMEMQDIEKLCQENRREDAVKKVHLLQEELLQIESPSVRVTILPRLAVVFFQLNLPQEAHQAFEEGLALFQSLNILPVDRVNQLAFFSRVAFLIQEKDLAQKLLHEAETLWKNLANDQEKGESCFYLALSYLDFGEKEKIQEMTHTLEQLVETSQDSKWKIDMKPCLEILEQILQEKNTENLTETPSIKTTEKSPMPAPSPVMEK